MFFQINTKNLRPESVSEIQVEPHNLLRENNNSVCVTGGICSSVFARVKLPSRPYANFQRY